MLISDIVKQAGKKLWPATEGEQWQLEIIERAVRETARPLLESIIKTAKELRELNAEKACAVLYGRRLPELENYLEKLKRT